MLHAKFQDHHNSGSEEEEEEEEEEEIKCFTIYGYGGQLRPFLLTFFPFPSMFQFNVDIGRIHAFI